jgi:mono/diheme cytochrome c family protein
VCNHLGPADETQDAADAAIENAINGKNIVACVAMDHGVTSGVNGDKAFTRYLIFGPSGQLLLSVNLDGRREKFVPGVCVACHGGDRYVGRFPENGTGFADIGAHFIPYDSGNFTFSMKAGYTQTDLEPVIHALNMNVLKAEQNNAISELIDGWYSGGTTTVINQDYIPDSWQVRPDVDKAFYKDVYARSCRTCHVAFTESLNFDHYANMTDQSQPVGETGYLRTEISACDGGSSSFVRNFSMPNSPRTLDLFWSSTGTAVDEPSILGTFLTTLFSSTITCSIQTSPNP